MTMNFPSKPDKLKNIILALILTAFVVALVLVRLAAAGLTPVPAPAPDRPDPERLQAHVRALASEPHPVGSEAHERARRSLLAALRAAGVEPITEDSSAISPVSPGLSRAGRARNVIARLPGNPGTDAVLLAAHYDSVTTGPGASDDASSAAGLLEAVRLLKAGGPLRNDVVFLFSDAEEIGMVGAQAFADESPLMKKIRAVFNFEARGTTGPPLLFETGPASAGLVSAFLAADPHPQGTSLATTVYRYLPNNTDFSVFKDRGLPGLNFACIGDLPAYHTRLDNVGRLDPRTLSLQADHILTCARTFGNADLRSPRSGEIVFFPVIGTFHLSYSPTAALILAVAAILLFGLVWFFGMRAGLSSIGKTLAAAGAVALLAVVSGGLAWGLDLLLRALHPENRSLFEWYNASWYRIALGLLPLFPAALLRRLWGRRLPPVHLVSGACLVFALLTAATAAVLPGASYLFQWPLLFAIPLLGLLLLREKKAIPSGFVVVSAALLCVPAILVGVNTFSLGADALTLAFVWAFVPLLALLLALAWPLFDFTLSRGGKLLPLLAAAGFAAMIAGGTLTSGFSAERPLPETLAYGLDADRDRAFWITCPDQPLAWSAQFFAPRSSLGPLPDFFPPAKGCLNQPSGFRRAPAPVVPLTPPLLTLTAEVAGVHGRDLTLLLRSPRGAPEATIYIERLPGMGDVSIDGKRIIETPIEKMKPVYQTIMRQLDYRRWIMIDFCGLPAAGVAVRLSAVPDRPLVVTVVDVSYDLPEQALGGFAPRPPSSMPGHALFVPNGTAVAKEYRFPVP